MSKQYYRKDRKGIAVLRKGIAFILEAGRIPLRSAFYRQTNPNSFYLPLTGTACRIKLTFSDSKQITPIEPSPAFDDVQWKQVVEEMREPGHTNLGATSASAASVLPVPGEATALVYRFPPLANALESLHFK